MTEITASLVKELREKTGAGMMDCKAALGESAGNMDDAVDWLRTKGLAKAAKKAGRIASEGLIGIAIAEKAGAMIELNSETDFVSRNEDFQKMVAEIAKLSLKAGGNLEKTLKTTISEGKNIEEYITEMVGTIGENMTLRRVVSLSVEEGLVISYIHGQMAPNLGKIGVLVALSSKGDKEKLAALGKQLAMHIAATAPQALSQESLDKDVIERERAVLIAEAKDSGRPDNIIEKMVEGRLNKFFQEVVLLAQSFVIDGETPIVNVLEKASEELGEKVEISGFSRFQLGEGIEKAEDDFASEVAAIAKS